MNKILDYLTIQQAAIFLGVAPNTLRNWERAKKIIAYRNPSIIIDFIKKKILNSYSKI